MDGLYNERKKCFLFFMKDALDQCPLTRLAVNGRTNRSVNLCFPTYLYRTRRNLLSLQKETHKSTSITSSKGRQGHKRNSRIHVFFRAFHISIYSQDSSSSYMNNRQIPLYPYMNYPSNFLL